MTSTLPKFPLSRDEAIERLKAEDSPYALKTETIHGVSVPVFAHAPNDLRDFFEFPIRHFPDQEFLVYEKERLTFQEVHRKACALSHSLSNLGVRPGDHVAIAMRNYPEYVIALEAVLSIGAVAVTLNSWWQSHELEYGLKDSGARFAIVDQDRYARIESFRDQIELSVALVRPTGKPPAGVHQLADLMQGEAASHPSVEIEPDADAVIMYTSGSTGHPKGVVLTHRSIVSALLGFSFVGLLGILIGEDETLGAKVLDWSHKGAAGMDDPLALRLPRASILLTVPLFHVAGMHTMLLLSYRGARKVVLMHKWDAEQALELVERESITHIEGVPTMVGEILNSPSLESRNLSGVVRIGGGGSARPPEHVKMLQERLPHVIPGTGYGMTETNAIATTIAGEDYIQRPDSVGRPIPPIIDIEIRDGQGQALPPNTEGEICMKSAANMRCYWNKVAATDEALREGWIYSGDLGFLDDEGFLYITGRAKDIIIRGGENIACAEIEYALYEHPAVSEAVVYGVPDERLGEAVAATVYLRPSEKTSVEDLQLHIRERLAAFKVPDRITFVSEPLPRIASGKFDKREARNQALTSPPSAQI